MYFQDSVPIVNNSTCSIFGSWVGWHIGNKEMIFSFWSKIVVVKFGQIDIFLHQCDRFVSDAVCCHFFSRISCLPREMMPRTRRIVKNRGELGNERPKARKCCTTWTSLIFVYLPMIDCNIIPNEWNTSEDKSLSYVSLDEQPEPWPSNRSRQTCMNFISFPFWILMSCG